MSKANPFRWEMVDGDVPVTTPESPEEALEMALTLSLVCQDFGAPDFIELAEETVEELEIDDETVANIKIKAEANANAIWAERLKKYPQEDWKIWSKGDDTRYWHMSALTQPGVSE